MVAAKTLVERVLKNREAIQVEEEKDEVFVLPDGTEVYASTLWALNRILNRNPHLHKRSTADTMRPYALYNGHVEISLEKDLLRLIGADWKPATKFQLVFLETYLLKLVPAFSKRAVLVSHNLVWDIDTQELRYLTEDDKIATVS